MTLIILRILRDLSLLGPLRIVRVQKHEKRKIIKEKEAKRKLTKKRDWDNII